MKTSCYMDVCVYLNSKVTGLRVSEIEREKRSMMQTMYDIGKT